MTEKTGAETPEVDETEETHEFVAVSNWEFVDRVPTVADVADLLKQLPDVYGLKYIDYLEFVQALPQTKKVKKKVTMPNGSYRTEDEFHDTYAVYMSVAGRVKMLNDAAEKHGWQVDFEPEPVTPTGAPGYISLEQRIVYREYVAITKWLEGEPDYVLGRKPGTAWVPQSGGKQAAGSNPYEKVETSARGRAIAAWGIGVLPGSGIASLEEVMGVGQNRAALEAEDAAGQGNRRGGGPERPPREELLESCLAVAEELRQERGIPEEEAREKMAKYLAENLGVRSVWDAEDKTIDWAKVKDGQILLLRNSMVDALRQLRDAGSQV